MIKTDYLTSVYDVQKFQKTADRCLRAAEQMRKDHPFDAIAFTGTSGAAMAYILSNMMTVPLICVRKSTEQSHYSMAGHGLIEGFTAAERYIIVDDMVCSGATAYAIRKAVETRIPRAKLVGMVLYNTRPSMKEFRFWDEAKPSLTVPVIGCWIDESPGVDQTKLIADRSQALTAGT